MAENTQGTDTPIDASTPSTPAAGAVAVPDKPALEGLEEKLTARWADERTYAFDTQTTREQVYSIDTPPPTASGSPPPGWAPRGAARRATRTSQPAKTHAGAKRRRSADSSLFTEWIPLIFFPPRIRSFHLRND